MAYLSEKVAYLKGLAEGMKLDDTKNEGKMLLKIIDVLDEIAATVEELDEEVLDNTERIEEVEDCLDDVCEDLY
ncbi:MAG: CD1247 N-terminal domain-containing protein, partial [Eubacteriales bacterium]